MTAVGLDLSADGWHDEHDEHDERGGHLDAGALLGQLARVEHERDQWRAAYLAASASADAASAARLAYYADGYADGFKAGAEVGHGYAAYVEARCAESHDVGWSSLASLDRAGGEYAKQDRKRYPSHDGRPAGRVYWLADTLGSLYRSWADLAMADDERDGSGGRQQ